MQAKKLKEGMEEDEMYESDSDDDSDDDVEDDKDDKEDAKKDSSGHKDSTEEDGGAPTTNGDVENGDKEDSPEGEGTIKKGLKRFGSIRSLGRRGSDAPKRAKKKVSKYILSYQISKPHRIKVLHTNC